MPIGLIVAGRPRTSKPFANGDDGAPRGRELEIADLLQFMKDRRIRNVVWITADVHYCAAHHYHPTRAKFTEFDPFWEFVAGPLNAGTFGPSKLDATFGPEVKFVGIPPGMKPNRPPSDGFQFFGQLRIDRRTKAMTVTLHDLSGKTIFSQELGRGVGTLGSGDHEPRGPEAGSWKSAERPSSRLCRALRFTPATLAFLRALKRNNDREWFKARRERYERDVREPMIAVIERLAVDFKTFAPEIVASPKASLYRIYRDTRFSNDKTPLKTHVAASFPWRGLHAAQGAGLYFEIAPAWVWIGGGMCAPEPPQLVRIREHIADTFPEIRS